MMAHAYAPKAQPPPTLFARWLCVRELQLRWEDTGLPLLGWEIGLLAQLISIWNEAQEMKARVGAKLRG